MESQVSGLLILAIFTATLGMFQFGWNSGVINAPAYSITSFINSSFISSNNGEPLEDSTLNLYFTISVVVFIIGGMVGGLTGGLVAERFGRRKGLLYSQVGVVLGVICMGVSSSANSYALLVLGRLCIGMSCGLFTGLVPLYINEISPISLRGGIGVTNQLAVTSGIFLSQILGLNQILGSRWPILLSLSWIPCLVQSFLLFFLPESPRYLIISKGETDSGRGALTSLRAPGTNIEPEMEELLLEKANSSPSVSLWQLLTSSSLRKPLVICILMHLSQQFTGIAGIFFYSTQIFTNAGIAEKSAQYATLGVGAIMVTMTIVTIPLLDRIGRRPIHLLGLTGMLLSTISITIALNIPNETSKGVLAFLIISILSFVVFFAIGPGGIPWLITGELFTQESRPAAFSVVTLVNWSASLIISFVFPLLQRRLQEWTFVPFGFILLVLLTLLFISLPETKNRSVSEIHSLLQNSKILLKQ